MTRTAIAPLFVTILLVVSGCNALDIGTTTDTLSVTPAPVPTNEPVPQVTPQQILCPTNSFVENVSALVAAHNETLWNTSFTLRTIYTEMYQNGSLRGHSVFTAHVNESHDRMYLLREWIEPDSPTPSPNSYEIWINDDLGVRRTISEHTVQYHTFQPVDDHFRSLAQFHTQVSEEILDGGNICIRDKFLRNKTTIYLIGFTNTPQGTARNATVLQNTTGYAFIDSRGIIHELRYDYTIRTADGAVVTVTERTYVTDIGSTTVDRPLWYGIAVNRTQTQNQTNVASDTARDQGSRTE